MSTLVPSLVIAGAMILAFIILRRKFRRHYVPRTFVGNLLPHERTPESPSGLFDWIFAMYRLPDTYVLQHHSLDAYLLLRYLKLISIVCLVGCCITWPILFPVNATGKGNKQQLDILAFSNVADPARYFAHALVAWIFLSESNFRLMARIHIADCSLEPLSSISLRGRSFSISICDRRTPYLPRTPIEYPLRRFCLRRCPMSTWTRGGFAACLARTKSPTFGCQPT